MKGKLGIIILGVVGLIVVAGAAAGAAYLMVKHTTPSQAHAAEEEKKVEEPKQLNDLEKVKTVPLKEFTTGLGDQRFVSVTFELVAKDEKEAAKISANGPLIRDLIIRILNGKKSSEVADDAGRVKLKADVQERINTLLGKPYVIGVLITDFKAA